MCGGGGGGGGGAAPPGSYGPDTLYLGCNKGFVPPLSAAGVTRRVTRRELPTIKTELKRNTIINLNFVHGVYV